MRGLYQPYRLHYITQPSSPEKEEMRIGIFFLVAVAALATTVLRGAEAADIHVGGATTWRIPADPNFYSSWATHHTFTVGDLLVFRFAADNHDVAGVTKEAYENCNTNNPNFVNSTTPFSFTLDKVSDYYFMCTVPGHCAAGQKLAITNVKQPSGSGPSSAVTPPPPPNSASALASTFTVAFISIAVANLIFNY